MSPGTKSMTLNVYTLTIALLVIFTLTSLQASQCQWIKHDDNPVLPLSESGWDTRSIQGGSIIKDGEFYLMWYSANNGTSWGIGMAESPDRIHWTKYEQSPLITNGSGNYDARYIWTPCVIRDGQGFKMWYTGSDPDYIWTINLATSQDGIVWETHPENPVLEPGPEWYDLERIGDPWVIYGDGEYEMWYTCQSRPEIMYGIAYAVSEDGIHWNKHADPVLLAAETGPDSSNVRDPCVIRTDSGYEMWYRGISNNWTICHATSPNGLDWSRDPDNPVLTGEPGSWDERVWFPRVLVEEDRYSMWFTSAENNEIGYAYMTIPELSLPAGVAVIIGGLALLYRRDVGLLITDSKATCFSDQDGGSGRTRSQIFAGVAPSGC